MPPTLVDTSPVAASMAGAPSLRVAPRPGRHDAQQEGSGFIAWSGLNGAGGFALMCLATVMAATPVPAQPSDVSSGNQHPASRSLGDLSGENQPASTRAMIARLDELWRRSDPLENFYLSAEAVEPSRTAIARASLRERFLMQAPHHYLLNAGDPEAALREVDAFEQSLGAAAATLPPEARLQLQSFRALCHLRLGEQENCLHHHNADSCLFPIQGGGVHRLQRGSRGAVGVFTGILEEFPHDLRARWLLNIAAMTLGEHPDGVPEKWRSNPSASPRITTSDGSPTWPVRSGSPLTSTPAAWS